MTENDTDIPTPPLTTGYSGGPIKIGFAVSPAKYRKTQWPEFSTIPVPAGVSDLRLVTDFCEFDGGTHDDLDVLVFKVADVSAMADAGNEYCGRQMRALSAYLMRRPSLLQIDPLSVQAILENREMIAAVLTKLDSILPRDMNIRSPATAVVRTRQNLGAYLCDFPFPAMCKKLSASGSDGCHSMSIVYSEVDLEDNNSPEHAPTEQFVLQEYINHDAVITKVFVVGHNIFVQQRPSLPNLKTPEEAIAAKKGLPLFHFDNKLPVGPQVEAWRSTKHGHVLLPNVSDAPTELDKGMLRAISRVLSSLLGNAALFGFDVIRQVNTGRLAIIDINHFPGYHGCFTPGEFFEMIMAIAHTRL